jgi:hypothetical protein
MIHVGFSPSHITVVVATSSLRKMLQYIQLREPVSPHIELTGSQLRAGINSSTMAASVVAAITHIPWASG